MGKQENAAARSRSNVRRARRKRKALTILTAIVGSFVLFGVFLLVWGYFDEEFDWQRFIGVRELETHPTEEGENADPVTPDALFTDADALTFFVTIDDQKVVDYAALISFSAKEMSVKVKPLPNDLKLTVSGREGTLSGLFGDYGAVGLRAGLEEKFGLSIRYYVSFTSANFKNLCQIVGNTEVRFDRPTAEFNDNAIKYSYKKGKYSLGGDALYAAIKNAYDGDERVAFRGSLTVDFLSQHLAFETPEDGERLFLKTVNLATTDVNSRFFDEYKDRISAFLAASPDYAVIK